MEADYTTDHNKIKSWIESVSGKPAKNNNDQTLAVTFSEHLPDYLEELSWEAFFKEFEDKKLEFLYPRFGEPKFTAMFVSRHTSAEPPLPTSPTSGSSFGTTSGSSTSTGFSTRTTAPGTMTGGYERRIHGPPPYPPDGRAQSIPQPKPATQQRSFIATVMDAFARVLHRREQSTPMKNTYERLSWANANLKDPAERNKLLKQQTRQAKLKVQRAVAQLQREGFIDDEGRPLKGDVPADMLPDSKCKLGE